MRLSGLRNCSRRVTFGIRNVLAVAAIPFDWIYGGMLGQFSSPWLWGEAQWREAA
jgi:hypothetical protein